MKFRILGGVAALSLLPGVVNADEENDEHHDLDEIVVTATPLARAVEKLALPTDVVDGDELIRRQSTSLGETLANQPGVNSTYFGPVAARPVIRGQYGERVLVLSNSLDSLDASALSEDHAVSIDSILAERVEILRGPATLLYGSGAAGGIVNIVDSRIAEGPLDKPISGAVALGTASATGKRTGAIKLDVGNENFVGHLDWFRRDTDNVEIPGFAESALLRALEEAEEHEEEEEGEEHEHEEEAFGLVENTASETDGGSAAFSFIGDFGFAGLSSSVYNTEYGIPGHHHEHEEEGEEEEEEEESVRIAMEQKRQDLSARFDMQGIFEHLKIRAATNDYQHTELEGGEIGTMFDTSGTDVRVELKHRAIANAEGAIGLQLKKIDFSAVGDEAYVPSSTTKQLGLFAFEEFVLSDAVVLQASGRLERQEIEVDGANDYDESALGVSLGALWGLSDAFTLSFNLAYAERHPNATELFADGPHIAVQRYERGSITLGAGRLDKEISTNLDVTLRGRFDRHEFSATTFINDIHDYIVLSPTALEIDELPVFDYRQTDAKLTGMELEWLVELMETDAGHLHASLLFDYVNGEQSGGLDLPRIPPMRIGAGLHYRNDALDASVEAMRVRSQSDVALNELPTDGYTMIDAEASYRFDEPEIIVFLRGTNLGDDDARRHTSPLKDIAPLPGRSIHLGLRWNF